MNQSYFKKLNDYFKYLVSQAPDIKNFISVSPRELQTVLSQTTKSDDPFLVFFGYEGKLDGNNQRTIGTRTVSFAILFRITDPNSFSDQYQKIDQAEDIGMQVLSRILQDSHPSSGIDWLRNAFQKDSVRFSEVTYETANGLFGCEFHFDLEIKNPLTAESGFWLDRDFCTT